MSLGSAYLFTSDLVEKLYNISFYIKFMWIDDYYITGLLIRGVKASYIQFNSLYNLNSDLTQERFIGKRGAYTVFGWEI